MLRSTLFLAAASLATGAVIQQPIAEQSSQSLVSEKHKPLIKSSSLQNDIKTSNLLKRAKQLYKIAEESIPEYNHPTRVIGSKGIFPFLHLLSCSRHLLTHSV